MFKNALVLAAGLLVTGSMSAMAENPKPRVVLSMASYDKVKMATDDVAFVKDAPELPAWLSSFFELYARGRDVAGLCHERPWGALIQGTDKLSGYAFVPVTDVEELQNELASYIKSVSDQGNGIYKVVGTEEGKQLYAKEANGWLFVSARAEVLETVCNDPVKLIDGMDKTYDVAVRLVLKNVPAERGRKILENLDKALGAGLRKSTSDKTVELLGKAAFELDEIVLGWSKR